MEGRYGWAAAFAALAIGMMAMPAAQRATAQQAASEQAKPDPATPDQGMIDKGKAVFAEHCSHCHGFNMVNAGTITPDLRKFPDDKPRFVTTVKQGKNNRMPPWGDLLSDDDIANLWAYVSSRRSQ
ncbi:c-type cytochrome [Bradyrhizobium sp.]|jgi:mono/diheme cytochrome c family protein|uniref:c-type cytochrome n=1 Tax=Bradyrhizobium sp. TaxID=376 RepID=UPI003C6B12AD